MSSNRKEFSFELSDELFGFCATWNPSFELILESTLFTSDVLSNKWLSVTLSGFSIIFMYLSQNLYGLSRVSFSIGVWMKISFSGNAPSPNAKTLSNVLSLNTKFLKLGGDFYVKITNYIKEITYLLTWIKHHLNHTLKIIEEILLWIFGQFASFQLFLSPLTSKHLHLWVQKSIWQLPQSQRHKVIPYHLGNCLWLQPKKWA